MQFFSPSGMCHIAFLKVFVLFLQSAACILLSALLYDSIKKAAENVQAAIMKSFGI